MLTALAAEFTPNIFYVRETVGLLTEETGESGEICHYSVLIIFCYALQYVRISDANSKGSFSQLSSAEE